jgi:nucleotide-binding universal stress UspA family protein
MDDTSVTTPISCILVAVDRDAASVAAVRRAAQLAAALDAELVLLAVVARAFLDRRYSSALKAAPEELTGDPEQVERMVAARVAYVSDVVPAGVRSRWVRGYEPAGPAIVQAADEVGADLVTLPMTRGNELSHVLRDVADRHVLHHSAVPVLVVPAG